MRSTILFPFFKFKRRSIDGVAFTILTRENGEKWWKRRENETEEAEEEEEEEGEEEEEEEKILTWVEKHQLVPM